MEKIVIFVPADERELLLPLKRKALRKRKVVIALHAGDGHYSDLKALADFIRQTGQEIESIWTTQSGLGSAYGLSQALRKTFGPAPKIELHKSTIS